MVRLIGFYSVFKIQIIKFLDFSEILTSFFDLLFILFVYVMGAGVAFAIGLYGGFSKFGDAYFKKLIKGKTEEEIEAKRSKYKKRFIVTAIISYPIIVFIIFLSEHLVLIAGGSYDLLNDCILWFKVYTFIFPIYFLGVYFYFMEKIKLKYFYLVLSCSIVAFIAISYSDGRIEGQIIKQNLSRTNVSFNYENELYKSDSSSYYINKTANYLFFFNGKEKQVEIFKMDKISKLTFSNKEK